MGRADIATQREMNARFDEIDRRFETVDRRLDEVRSLMLWLFSAQVAMTGVVLAIVKLT
jgi:hypothetical protein